MSTPFLHPGYAITVSITAADLATIKGEGYPKFAPSVTRFHHTTTPYKHISSQVHHELAAVAGTTLTANMSNSLKEVVAAVADVDAIVVVREGANSRFYSVTVAESV